MRSLALMVSLLIAISLLGAPISYFLATVNSFERLNEDVRKLLIYSIAVISGIVSIILILTVKSPFIRFIFTAALAANAIAIRETSRTQKKSKS